MIKAVIFDCFGVLATDGWLSFRDAHFGGKPDLLEEARAHNIRVDRGLMSYDEFIQWLSDTTGETLATVRQVIQGNVPNSELFEYIRDTISPTYQVGLLSNAGANWLDRMFSPWQVALFDGIVLSYEVGAVKPDPIMYETIALRLGVLPEEAVFIDDRIEFVTGAHAIGMQAVQYQSMPQIRTELEAILHARTA